MKLISGPMATLSTEAFRVLVEQFGGCDEYFTEMINASTLITGGPWEKFYLINKTAPDKMVWQLTGHQADKIIQGADFLCSQNLGGIGIDLNMGCPSNLQNRCWNFLDVKTNRRNGRSGKGCKRSS